MKLKSKHFGRHIRSAEKLQTHRVFRINMYLSVWFCARRCVLSVERWRPGPPLVCMRLCTHIARSRRRPCAFIRNTHGHSVRYAMRYVHAQFVQRDSACDGKSFFAHFSFPFESHTISFVFAFFVLFSIYLFVYFFAIIRASGTSSSPSPSVVGVAGVVRVHVLPPFFARLFTIFFFFISTGKCYDFSI